MLQKRKRKIRQGDSPDSGKHSPLDQLWTSVEGAGCRLTERFPGSKLQITPCSRNQLQFCLQEALLTCQAPRTSQLRHQRCGQQPPGWVTLPASNSRLALSVA